MSVTIRPATGDPTTAGTLRWWISPTAWRLRRWPRHPTDSRAGCAR